MTEPPPGWASVSIEDVAETASGGTPLRGHSSYFGGKIMWFKSGELNDSILPSESEETLTETGLQKSSAKHFPSATVLIAMYGATVGKLGILQAPATTNQAVCGIIPSRAVTNKFLFYFLLSQRQQLLSKRVGGAQPNINQQVIRDLAIPVAPLPEQRRIVAEIEKQFTRLDEALVALERVSARSRALRSKLLAEAAGAPCPTRLFGDLLSEPLANGRSVPTASSIDAAFPVLKLTAVRNGRIDTGQCKAGAWTRGQARPFIAREEDFLIVRGNGSRELVGRAGVVGKLTNEVAYPDTLIRARFRPELVYTPFLTAVWDGSFVRHQIERAARTTAGIYKVNQNDLEKLEIPLPDLATQKARFAIWSVYQSILNSAEVAVISSAFRSRRLRQAILTKAFSGQLVPQDPNDEPAIVLLERIRAERRLGTSKTAAKRRGSRQRELTLQT